MIYLEGKRNLLGEGEQEEQGVGIELGWGGCRVQIRI